MEKKQRLKGQNEIRGSKGKIRFYLTLLYAILYYLPMQGQTAETIRLTHKLDTNILLVTPKINETDAVFFRNSQEDEKDGYKGSILIVALVVGFIVLLLWVWYRYMRHKKQKRYTVRKILRLQAMISSEEMERIKLSQDLRDGIDSSLAAINFHIQSLEQRYPEIAGDVSLLMARQLILVTSSEVRSIAHQLSPHILAKAGLKGALEECCAPLFQGKVHIEVQTYGALETLPGNMTLFLYRIAHELLHHIIIHARAQEVIVVLGLDSRAIALTIEYDGRGIKANQSHPSSIGIENLKQRVIDFQGELTIDSGPEKGTVVHMVIPWQR